MLNFRNSFNAGLQTGQKLAKELLRSDQESPAQFEISPNLTETQQAFFAEINNLLQVVGMSTGQFDRSYRTNGASLNIGTAGWIVDSMHRSRGVNTLRLAIPDKSYPYFIVKGYDKAAQDASNRILQEGAGDIDSVVSKVGDSLFYSSEPCLGHASTPI